MVTKDNENGNIGLDGFMESAVIHTVMISDTVDCAREFMEYADAARDFIAARYILRDELEKGLVTEEDIRKAVQGTWRLVF